MPAHGISETTMGWVYSSYLILYTICMIPGGWFIDRFGTRAALMVVGFGSAFFVVLTGLSGILIVSGGMLIISSQLLGSAACCGEWSPLPIHPVAPAAPFESWITDLLPIRRRTAWWSAPCAYRCLFESYFLFWQHERLVWLDWSVCRARRWHDCVGCTALDQAAATEWFHPQHPAVNDAERKKIEAGGRIFPAERNSAQSTLDPERAPAARPKLMLLTLNYTSLLGLMRTIARTPRSLILLTLSYATVNYVEYLFFYWIQYYFEKVLALVSTNDLLAGSTARC